MSTHDEHRFGPDGITPRQFWLMVMNGNMKAGQLIAIQKADGTLREVVVTYYDAGPPFRIETTDDPEAIEKAREAARAKPVGTVTNGLIDSTPTERADHGLRERIASIQRLHRIMRVMVSRQIEYRCLCGWRSPERDCTWTDHPEHVADAVIRELGLWEKFRKTEKPWSREIITDWETDE